MTTQAQTLKPREGQTFFFRDAARSNRLTMATATMCEKCGALCTVNAVGVSRALRPVFTGEVAGELTLAEDGSTVCWGCYQDSEG